jgi:hypothetical protein
MAAKDAGCGLSFILAGKVELRIEKNSLHNESIAIWDFRMETKEQRQSYFICMRVISLFTCALQGLVLFFSFFLL